MRFIEVFSEAGELRNCEWLECAARVHRQLRPHLPADYTSKMSRVLADARMALAVDGDEVLGLAVYRWHENTYDDVKFYIDDLVIDEAHRSIGVGHALIEYLESVAHGLKASGLVLDSGMHRTRAHKFYFREGFVISSFNFKKTFT